MAALALGFCIAALAAGVTGTFFWSRAEDAGKADPKKVLSCRIKAGILLVVALAFMMASIIFAIEYVMPVIGELAEEILEGLSK